MVKKVEIEFNYYYFQKKYNHTCKQCESQTKSVDPDTGDLAQTIL